MEPIDSLLTRQELLDTEFEPYIYEDESLGLCIKHPLYFSIMHNEALNAIANANLRQKLKAVEEALGQKRWSRYLLMHERPWRFDALQRISPDVDDEEYWELVRDAWIDSENIWENEDGWIELFTADRPRPEQLLHGEDRAALEGMPSVLRLYRGFCREDRRWGLSWTLDRDKAEWFACRYQQGTPGVQRGTVPQGDIFGYFTQRNESEVIVLPHLVDDAGEEGL